jgi:hypothetical protein
MDERIILKWIFKKLDGGMDCTGLVWLRIGIGGGGALVNAILNIRLP